MQREARGRPVSELGPLAGRTLRICFCQPWDGAENSGGTACTSGKCDDHDRVHRAREGNSVENVRIVTGEWRDGGCGG